MRTLKDSMGKMIGVATDDAPQPRPGKRRSRILTTGMLNAERKLIKEVNNEKTGN